MNITERIDAVTEIPPRYKAAFLPPPKSVKIELTAKCNYRCGFCALRTREKQPRRDMSFDLFKKVVNGAKAYGIEEVGVFFLGESTMAPRLLVEAIAYAKQWIQIPYVFLTTNGSMCNRKLLFEMMSAGLDSLKFSINACDAEQFERIMGVKGRYFENALKAVKTAHKVRERYDLPCGLYASSIMFDGEQGERMERLLDERVRPYVDEHYYLPLYSMGAFATQREEELGYRPIAGNQGRLGALRQPLPCWSAFTEAHVRADGGLSACCFDAGGQWLMGDLSKQSWIDAWNSEAFMRLREAHLAGDVTGTACENCVAYT
jgi:MoaA/NifB/PqqE/SkfB family radical SAM enzyme